MKRFTTFLQLPLTAANAAVRRRSAAAVLIESRKVGYICRRHYRPPNEAPAGWKPGYYRLDSDLTKLNESLLALSR